MVWFEFEIVSYKLQLCLPILINSDSELLNKTILQSNECQVMYTSIEYKYTNLNKVIWNTRISGRFLLLLNLFCNQIKKKLKDSSLDN